MANLMTTPETRYYKDEARYQRDIKRYGQDLADRLDHLYHRTGASGLDAAQLARDVKLANAAADFRVSVDHSGGKLTVGMLRDWLDACTTDDDQVELYSHNTIIVNRTIHGLGGGPERLVCTGLEVKGSYIESWSTVPSVPDLNLYYQYTSQDFKDMLEKQVTRPWRPSDDEPQAPGWDVQPPTTDESETHTHG